MILKTLLTFTIALLFSACSTNKNLPINFNDKDFNELSKTSNSNFAQNINASKKDFIDKYFWVWNLKELTYSKKEASWGLGYKNRKIYLENHQRASKQWFDYQILNSNFQEYNSLKIKAITLVNTDLRVLPTSSVLFYNPTKPGEGFPFDYNQNSLLKINTPLVVSHYSKDKAWVYVQSAVAGGWVKTKNIAFVDKEFIKTFKTNDYYVSIFEKFFLYDNEFREYVKIGTIFPKKYNKYLIAKKQKNGYAKMFYSNIKEQNISKFPLEFNPSSIQKISKQLIYEPYGWGGLKGHRDCSSFTQDFFTVFGKFLSRNSKAQKSNGKYLSVKNLNNVEKKRYILENAVPFSTLIYLRGHIMLYIGSKNNEPLVMHNIWSVKLKNLWGEEYRHIIGKTQITTLEVGKTLDNFDEDKNVLNRVEGIIVL
ncbi:MAG: SH3 domain-containing protein [Sulfurovum sp.]